MASASGEQSGLRRQSSARATKQRAFGLPHEVCRLRWYSWTLFVFQIGHIFALKNLKRLAPLQLNQHGRSFEHQRFTSDGYPPRRRECQSQEEKFLRHTEDLFRRKVLKRCAPAAEYFALFKCSTFSLATDGPFAHGSHAGFNTRTPPSPPRSRRSAVDKRVQNSGWCT